MFIIISKAKLFIIIGCFVLASAALIYITHNYKHALSIEEPQVDVVLDAGHGGFDGGASGADGVLEKNLNLTITLKLRDKLVASGITVGLTRDSDIALGDTKKKDMYWRRDFTIASKPQIFVSIHQNKFSQTQYRGAQVFYSKNNPESKDFAINMQSLLKETNLVTNREAKQAENSVFLLRTLTMPSIIVECGFLSNYEEEQLLGQDAYQDKLAEILRGGIISELERIKTMPTPSIAPSGSVMPTAQRR